MWKQQDNNHYSRELLQCVKVLYRCGELCDVELGGHDGGTINCHRVILSAASDHFKSKLADKSVGSMIKFPVETSVLRIIVDYIYSGTCSFTSFNMTSLFDASVALNLPQLRPLCLSFISKHFNIYNVVQLFSFAFKDKYLDLMKSSAQYITENIQEIHKTNQLDTLNCEQLLFILPHRSTIKNRKDTSFLDVVMHWILCNDPSSVQVKTLMEKINLNSPRNEHSSESASEESVRDTAETESLNENFTKKKCQHLNSIDESDENIDLSDSGFNTPSDCIPNSHDFKSLQDTKSDGTNPPKPSLLQQRRHSELPQMSSYRNGCRSARRGSIPMSLEHLPTEPAKSVTSHPQKPLSTPKSKKRSPQVSVKPSFQEHKTGNVRPMQLFKGDRRQTSLAPKESELCSSSSSVNTKRRGSLIPEDIEYFRTSAGKTSASFDRASSMRRNIALSPTRQKLRHLSGQSTNSSRSSLTSNRSGSTTSIQSDVSDTSDDVFPDIDLLDNHDRERRINGKSIEELIARRDMTLAVVNSAKGICVYRDDVKSWDHVMDGPHWFEKDTTAMCAFPRGLIFATSSIKAFSRNVVQVDLISKTMKQLPKLPMATSHVGIAYRKGSVYVAGGRLLDFDNIVSDYLYRLTISSGSEDEEWEKVLSLVNPVCSPIVLSIKNDIFMIGGRSETNDYTNTIQVYNENNNTISSEAFEQKCDASADAAVNRGNIVCLFTTTGNARYHINNKKWVSFGDRSDSTHVRPVAWGDSMVALDSSGFENVLLVYDFEMEHWQEETVKMPEGNIDCLIVI